MHDHRDLTVPVYRSRQWPQAKEYALVLKAVDIECEIARTDSKFELLVHPKDVTRAHEQLALYANENEGWVPLPESQRTPANAVPGVAAYAATLLSVELLQRYQLLAHDWVQAGKAHAGLIVDGQWWRTLTALTLHADPAHLAGNLVFGVVFGWFAGQFLGSGLAWFAILLAGALGNAANAVIQPPMHTSVGASTAVFAALGLLSAYTWRRRSTPGRRRIELWAPLVGGVALLAYTGVGGERTDVAAHLTGFLAGAMVGTVFATLGNRVPPRAGVQLALGTTAAAILAAAWWEALHV